MKIKTKTKILDWHFRLALQHWHSMCVFCTYVISTKILYVAKNIADFDSLHLSQQFFSYAGTVLPGLNQYYAGINMSCSMTQCSAQG